MILDDISSLDMVVPFFLMASYSYYIEDDPILTDGDYDTLRRALRHVRRRLRHRHRHYLDLDAPYSLTADDYPTIVKHSLTQWRRLHDPYQRTRHRRANRK